MILIGEGKLHADNLPDASYYAYNKEAICKSLFAETCFGIRFSPVILETIKKSHPTLPYIMRNQYMHADLIYKAILEVPKEAIVSGTENKFCFGLIDRLKSCQELQTYYRDVCEYLINPVFKRFGYYSPTMSLVIFIGLLCIAGDFYSSKFYSLVWKHFIKSEYPFNIIFSLITSLPELDRMMITDEINSWKIAKQSPCNPKMHLIVD